MQLSDIIIQRIEHGGPISFRDYMEMCLYYPEIGYYTSPREKIGRNGDFFTSSSVSPAFGAMIARQLLEMWEATNESDFTVVEYGAGTGLLCHDILHYFKENVSRYPQLNYVIIEKNGTHQNGITFADKKIETFNSIEDVADVTGCVLSNELVDNFPVHLVEMKDELKEVYIDYRDGFIEVLKPAKSELLQYFMEIGVELPYGFRAEVNLQAVDWMKEVADALDKGFIMTIDYGSYSGELYRESKKRGTVMCYRKHSLSEDPFVHIGQQDITSHVNFSALQHWGGYYGLENCGYSTQADFLLSLGYRDYVGKRRITSEDIISIARREAINAHTLLVEMGTKYKVLVQKKGVGDCALSGFPVGCDGLVH